MAQCTAPIKGHRTASAAAACPACSSRYNNRGYYGGNNYGSHYFSTTHIYKSTSSGSKSLNSTRPKWSPAGSSILYSEAEIRALSPIRSSIEKREKSNDNRDVFLCHAWDDRRTIAKELHDQLELAGVSVWFSEKDVPLGTSLLREIDKGLARSKVGIVLVTPAFLSRIRDEGIAEKELSALLARDLLVPIVHNTSYEALRDVSPLLGSRSGLSTSEDSIENVAKKISELVEI